MLNTPCSPFTRTVNPSSSFDMFDKNKIHSYQMFRNSTYNKLFAIAAVNSKNHIIHYEKTAMNFEDACEEVQTLNAIFEEQQQVQ